MQPSSGARCLIFSQTLCPLPCAGSPEPSLVAYVMSTIISFSFAALGITRRNLFPIHDSASITSYTAVYMTCLVLTKLVFIRECSHWDSVFIKYSFLCGRHSIKCIGQTLQKRTYASRNDLGKRFCKYWWLHFKTKYPTTVTAYLQVLTGWAYMYQFSCRCLYL